MNVCIEMCLYMCVKSWGVPPAAKVEMEGKLTTFEKSSGGNRIHRRRAVSNGRKLLWVSWIRDEEENGNSA